MRPVPPRWRFAAKVALAGAALAGLAVVAHPADVARTLVQADGRWLAAALALLPLNVALEAVRWGRLAQRAAPGVRMRDAVTAVVAAYPLGLLTPGRVGDYVGRAALLPALAPGASAALTFAERMATLLCCLVGGLVALVWNPAAGAGPAAAWQTAAVVAGVLSIVLLAAFSSPDRTARVASALVPIQAIRRALDAFRQIPRGEVAVLLGLSAVRYVVFSAQFVLLVRAFAPGVPLVPVAAGVAVTYLLKSAVPQVTLGDLGVREGVAVFVLAGAGVAPAAALGASLAVFAVNLLLPALAGIPLLMRLRLPARFSEAASDGRTAPELAVAEARLVTETVR